MVMMICFGFSMAAVSTEPQRRAGMNGMEGTYGMMGIFSLSSDGFGALNIL